MNQVSDTVKYNLLVNLRKIVEPATTLPQVIEPSCEDIRFTILSSVARTYVRF
jgi:hypothetical protein